jgi:hypothetical protein
MENPWYHADLGIRNGRIAAIGNLKDRAATQIVAREPLRRVHECVFGVLALESEPVDPRL